MTYNHYNLLEGNRVNECIATLPVATEQKVYTEKNGRIPNRKAILVGNEVVDVVSDRYSIVQHAQAFRPIIEGLTVRGIQNFKFSIWATTTRANMNVFVGKADDGVNFGFKCTNSFNRTSAVNYGFSAKQISQTVEIVEKDHVLVWGMRQVCSNGMVMRVPLKTCKYLDTELVTKVKELLTQRTRLKHVGMVHSRLEDIQYVVEAFLLLKNPINMMIADAQNYPLSKQRAMFLIQKYVGRRRMDKYLQLYKREEQTLWGLYNAFTFYASHEQGISDSARERKLLQSAELLEKELIVPSEA